MNDSDANRMLIGSAAVFLVKAVAASLAHYRDILGFGVEFLWGEPPTYACLCRDAVALHLVAESISGRAAGQGQLCVFVSDVDAVHAELAAKNACIVKPPQTYEYGMREFDLVDIDGNRIVMGMAAASDKTT